MKYLILALVIFLLVPTGVVLAQDTAVGTLTAIDPQFIIMTVTGLVSTYLTKFLKEYAPFLNPEEKGIVNRLSVQLIALVIPAALAIGTIQLMPLAQRLDDGGAWVAITAIGAVMMSQGGFFLESGRISLKKMAQAK